MKRVHDGVRCKRSARPCGGAEGVHSVEDEGDALRVRVGAGAYNFELAAAFCDGVEGARREARA